MPRANLLWALQEAQQRRALAEQELNHASSQAALRALADALEAEARAVRALAGAT